MQSPQEVRSPNPLAGLRNPNLQTDPLPHGPTRHLRPQEQRHQIRRADSRVVVDDRL